MVTLLKPTLPLLGRAGSMNSSSRPSCDQTGMCASPLAIWRFSPVGGNGSTNNVFRNWRRDGKELYYISPDLNLMAVPVTRKGQKLEFGAPTELFQTRISLGGTLAYRMLRYDVTRDGQRFLINSEPESAPPFSSSITVILNWTELLRR
jgi:hypothetical protein